MSNSLCVTMGNDSGTAGEDRNLTADILNDKCLLNILNRLDLHDLCNVASINRQFKRVSMMSFSGRYKKFNYPYDLKMTSDLRSQMRRVLSNFGHLIKSLKLKDFAPAGIFYAFGRFYPMEMDAISKYCAGTLDELKFEFFGNFECDSTKPLFASLKVLKINCSNFEGDVSGLFKQCAELRTLKLRCIPFDDSDFAQRYPKLEELYIETSVTVRAMSALIKLNPQIRKLATIDCNANKAICPFASKMDQLEELILKSELNDYENISELGKLKSLKFLELNGIDSEFVPALEAMENVPIQRLEWYDCPTNLEFVNSILKLKTLKRLVLSQISSFFDDFLLKLGEQLPLLEELELGFKHQKQALFSTGYLKRLVERSPKLHDLAIHTTDFELFDQKFADSLTEVIWKRNGAKKFQVTVYSYRDSTPLQNDLLNMEFIGEECGCSYCDPFGIDYYDDFDDDLDVDLDDL